MENVIIKEVKPIELEGKWIRSTVLTITLSHFSLLVLIVITAYNEQDIFKVITEYLLQGTLFISGISLMASTFLSKKEQEIPKCNLVKFNNVKLGMVSTLFFQGILYGVSYSSNSPMTLTNSQVITSMLLYIITIILLCSFNYFNRMEKKYIDDSIETMNSIITKSKDNNDGDGIAYD